jgi:hypothetical protein
VLTVLYGYGGILVCKNFLFHYPLLFFSSTLQLQIKESISINMAFMDHMQMPGILDDSIKRAFFGEEED